jgi:hypothetical protein
VALQLESRYVRDIILVLRDVRALIQGAARADEPGILGTIPSLLESFETHTARLQETVRRIPGEMPGLPASTAASMQREHEQTWTARQTAIAAAVCKRLGLE